MCLEPVISEQAISVFLKLVVMEAFILRRIAVKNGKTSLH